jgi:hypothetical protein
MEKEKQRQKIIWSSWSSVISGEVKLPQKDTKNHLWDGRTNRSPSQEVMSQITGHSNGLSFTKQLLSLSILSDLARWWCSVLGEGYTKCIEHLKKRKTTVSSVIPASLTWQDWLPLNSSQGKRERETETGKMMIPVSSRVPFEVSLSSCCQTTLLNFLYLNLHVGVLSVCVSYSIPSVSYLLFVLTLLNEKDL